MTKRVYVAGHKGMVGRALVRQLQKDPQIELVTQSRDQLDLLSQAAVQSFFKSEKIDQVYLAAAKVGGIHANNSFPAEFIHENLIIQSNVIDAAHRSDVQKLLFLGSSCIYPRNADQPMAEEALLTGPLEPTNEPYAIAKIAGIKTCESYNRQYGRDYRSVMPTNLYGPHDNFHPENSHVLPALLHRIYEAGQAGLKEVVIWGSGMPKREFLHVDDMAEASIFVMGLLQSKIEKAVPATQSHINIGTGQDISIAGLAKIIAQSVGYGGKFKFDSTKPDGAPRKLLNVSRLEALGWTAGIDLENGLKDTFKWYLGNRDLMRR